MAHRGGSIIKAGRRWAVWFGIVALLMQALLPLGQAVAATAVGDGAPAPQWVCSAYGIKALPDRKGPNGNGPADTASESFSCPFCQVHALTLVLPEPTAVPVPLESRARDASVATVAVHPARIAAPAFPRGPPAIV